MTESGKKNNSRNNLRNETREDPVRTAAWLALSRMSRRERWTAFSRSFTKKKENQGKGG